VIYCCLSFNKYTLCKSLWIKASAKCPKCKCKCCYLAWLAPPSVYEWVNVRQYCKALWINALYKCNPFTIYQNAFMNGKITYFVMNWSMWKEAPLLPLIIVSKKSSQAYILMSLMKVSTWLMVFTRRSCQRFISILNHLTTLAKEIWPKSTYASLHQLHWSICYSTQ